MPTSFRARPKVLPPSWPNGRTPSLTSSWRWQPTNRRARAGQDPCGAAGPLTLAALHEGSSVDLSSGAARAVFDIYSDDATAAFDILASLECSKDGEGNIIPISTGGAPIVHDGDSIALDLRIGPAGVRLAASDQWSRVDVGIQLCPIADGGRQDCVWSSVPASAWPLFDPSADGGKMGDGGMPAEDGRPPQTRPRSKRLRSATPMRETEPLLESQVPRVAPHRSKWRSVRPGLPRPATRAPPCACRSCPRRPTRSASRRRSSPR
jgi:hypothetical protein